MRLVLAFVVLASTLAAAEDTPRRAPDWNLGAGVGLQIESPSMVGTLGGVGGLGGLNGIISSGLLSSVSPTAAAFVERRLGERSWLMFQAAVGYTGQTLRDSGSNRLFTANGRVGARYVLNPHGLIEVSWYGAAHVAWRSWNSGSLQMAFDPQTNTVGTELTTYKSTGLSIGAVTGVVLERELIEGLALRLSTSILGASYSSNWAQVSNNVSLQQASGDGVDVGLRFSPSLELRYSF
ncbi:MAG: hypothetical protein ACOZQL_00020 [Myxococcota bacterium]